MMAITGLPARRAAWEALRRVHADAAWSSPAVDGALQRAGLDARDRAFAANLAFETLRWEGTLDWLLGRVVTRDLAEVEPELLDVLRLGAWQLRYGRVPDRATVDTSVELARRVVGPRATGFTNGVLRALARVDPTLPAGDDDAAVGLALAYPAWTVTAARERFGDRARAVLEAGNAPPGLVLRAAGDPDTLCSELIHAGWNAGAGAHPRAVRVPGGVAAVITAVAEGRATVQDEASMYVIDATVAAAGAGGLVLDLCAGPGGKTTGLVEAGARVVAGDVHPVRARLVADLAARGPDPADPPPGADGGAPSDGHGGVSVGVVAADAARPPFRDGIADAVLIDAPCTGLGVVRRRPELRWRRRAEDPGRLGALQGGLLGAAARLVRPGGALVYSVCTWPAAETRDVVTAFLTGHPGWHAERPGVDAGTFLPDDPGVQLTPDTDGTDGMYVAVLRREATA